VAGGLGPSGAGVRHNVLALGDFNIDRRGDALYEAFTSTGLRPPEQLNQVPRTIFDEDAGHFYNQIAWFTGAGGVPQLSMSFTGRGGGVDFVPHAAPGMSKTELSWRLSDHYPLWVEFALR
jgi:endonuclease/exonuclease/phosphatase (EEP) superfamily protein YafD